MQLATKALIQKLVCLIGGILGYTGRNIHNPYASLLPFFACVRLIAGTFPTWCHVVCTVVPNMEIHVGIIYSLRLERAECPPMAGKHFLLHDTGSLIPRPQYCAHMIFVVSFPGLNLALIKSSYLSFRPKTPSVFTNFLIPFLSPPLIGRAWHETMQEPCLHQLSVCVCVCVCVGVWVCV